LLGGPATFAHDNATLNINVYNNNNNNSFGPAEANDRSPTVIRVRKVGGGALTDF